MPTAGRFIELLSMLSMSDQHCKWPITDRNMKIERMKLVISDTDKYLVVSFIALFIASPIPKDDGSAMLKVVMGFRRECFLLGSTRSSRFILS